MSPTFLATLNASLNAASTVFLAAGHGLVVLHGQGDADGEPARSSLEDVTGAHVSGQHGVADLQRVTEEEGAELFESAAA